MSTELQITMLPTNEERMQKIDADRTAMLEGLHLLEEYNIIPKEESKNILEKILETSRKQLSFLLSIDGAFGTPAKIEELHRAVDSTWASFQGGRHPVDIELNPTKRDKSI